MKTHTIPDKPKLKQIAIDGLIIGGFGIVIATAFSLHIGMRFYLWARHWINELKPGERETW